MQQSIYLAREKVVTQKLTQKDIVGRWYTPIPAGMLKLLQVGSLPDHCPFAWQVRVSSPTRQYPQLQL